MAEDHTFIGSVRGANPERFAVITMHADWSGPKHVTFLTENELRENLRKMGMVEEDIKTRISHWRENPV